nr:TIGR02281 family clan AA aspartic protease [Sphingomonas bacterium]
MGINGLFYLLLLILPIAALLSRRVPLLRLIGQLAIWAAIFGLGLLLLGQRERFDPYLQRAATWLKLDDQSVVGKEVRIRMAADGHFWAKVTIGGVQRRMLIDSGATVTAVSTDTAADAGLKVSEPAFPMMLRTANGTISAQVATVDELGLGDIVARKLSVVVSPAFGDTDVLGMNFLSRLKSWRVEGSTLILTPHHPRSFT